ncbi:MAG: hypothetical protein K0Q72_3303 [Armatimonadetes bacterium]|jgi:hypothetical protein|nr:hypothetical protein [Armatimonadota bacterium]
MPTCINHPYEAARQICPDCGIGYCDACLVEFLGQRVCGPCRDRRLAQMTNPTDAGGAPLAGTGVVDLGGWLARAWGLMQADLLTWALAALVGGLVNTLTCGIAGPAIYAGFFLMAFRKMSTGSVDLAHLFDGFQRFGYALLLMLLVSIGHMAALIVVGLPISVVDAVAGEESVASTITGFLAMGLLGVAGVIIQAATFFALPHIAARNANPVDAIMASFTVFRRNWGMFVALTLVWGLVYLAGALLCGIGALVTGPLVLVATAQAYADHFGIRGWDAA